MKKLIYVSGTRADYGLMARSLKLWANSGQVDVSLCVTGMHLMHDHGYTVRDIERDGLNVCAKVPVDLAAATGSAMAKGVGLALIDIVDVFEREKPDMVVVLGDRGEMLAGALAAIHLNIPVVHIHGGERSGTIDEPVRHAISKLSHYHFTATEGARERLIRMGELPEHVFTVGAPGLDGLKEEASFSREDLCGEIGFDIKQPVALLLFHPVVQDADIAGKQMRVILNALSECGLQTLCLMPNADAGGLQIRKVLNSFVQQHKNIHVVTHFPRKVFVSWMKHADVMLGNSSSGIIEAATFSTSVVNIGCRQQGRERSINVMDVEVNQCQIEKALAFCIVTKKKDIENVYGDGESGEKMLALLTALPLDKQLLNKLNAY